MRRLHTCVKKIQRIRWIGRDGFWTFRTRVAEVVLTVVRGRFDRFLMTPCNVCQNTSCNKKRAALAQAANQTRENFDAVTTRTSYAPVWLQSQKMQSLRWRDSMVMLRRVQEVVFAALFEMRMEIAIFKSIFNNKILPYF